MPDGKKHAVPVTGDLAWWEYVSYAALALAGIALTVLTVGGAAPLVTGLFIASGLASVVSTTAAMIDDYQHEQLTTKGLTLYALEIVTSLLQIKIGLIGRFVNKSAQVANLTPMIKYANMVYMPLQTTSIFTEGLQMAILSYDAALQIEAINNGPGTDEEKQRAVFILLSQLTITGGFFILSAKGYKDDATSFKNKSLELVPDGDNTKLVVGSGEVNHPAGAGAERSTIPKLEGVDPHVSARMGALLGEHRASQIDEFISNNHHKLKDELDIYGTEAVYHAVNLSDGGTVTRQNKPDFSISTTKSILKNNGSEFAENYAIQKQKKSIEDVESGKTKLEGYGEKPGDYTRKGTYGEMKMDQYFESLTEIRGNKVKLKRISRERVTNIDTPGEKGIDGVYENLLYPPPPKYIIAESKFGQSELNKKNKQMSIGWIKKNLNNAVDSKYAEDILFELDFNPENVESLLFKVDEAAKINIYKVNSSGIKGDIWE